MSTGKGALIIGSNQAAIQAALDLAVSGIPVTLVEQSPFLGGPSIPQMLEAVKHPLITLVTDAQVTAVRGPATQDASSGRGAFQVDIQRKARYVDVDRCTACGDCAAVCPMPLPGHGLSEHCAIYKPAPQAVPNVFAIEKMGTAPCRNACPIDQRAQGYIALIRERRFADAYLTIKEENPFPSICGRVCNHRCEEACNRAKVDAPLNIMGLKRFVADWAAAHPEEIAAATPKVEVEPKGKRVAIVGAGPAGLTAALDLVRMGYGVTVFEAQPVAGGMMRLGVPDHRLPPDVVQREIDDIVATGVELKLNHRVEDMGALLEKGFDAIFIAVGAHLGAQLPILGANLPDVHLATDYLRAANMDEPMNVAGKRVLVIGGGNVGLDVAQVAVRTGAAWVGMSCLESREQMPAFDWEIRDAEEEGVHIFPGRSFKEVTGASYVEGEWVTGVRCVQVDFRGFVDGRPDIVEIPGTEENIPADVVVFAVGQWPDLTGVPDELEKVRGRWLVADERTQITNIPGVTAGGDVVTGTRFIVDAIAAGHKAAHALDTYLATGVPAGWQATNPSQQVVEFTPQEAKAKLQDRGARYAANIPRKELSKLPAAERKNSFVEMYSGFTEEEAVAEAKRCLVCGACSECLACVRVCQAEAINHYQEPEQMSLGVDAVIWADEDGSIPKEIEEHVYRLYGSDPLVASAVAARAMSDLAAYRRKTAPPVPRSIAAVTEAPRIGVFVCRCGDKIGEVLDVDELVDAAGSMPNVVYARDLAFSCQPEAAATIKSAAADHGLNRVVLAACSCCSLDQACDSCTYQRVRCKSNLLGLPFELLNPSPRSEDGARDGAAVEFVNIREQCAWVHRDNPSLAMVKAKRLIAAAVAKAELSPRLPRTVVEIDGRVLVAGEGEAAIVCANALRAQSIAVAHCEEIPVAMSGSLGQFTVTLRSNNWQWQVDASAVVLAPADLAQLAHLRPPSAPPPKGGDGGGWGGIFLCSPAGDAEMIGTAMAAQVGATLGSGRIVADHNIAQVDPSRCLGCGACESVCEHFAIQIVEIVPEERDPISILMEMTGRATREEGKSVAQVNPALCQGCGACAAHCPTSAITAGYSTDKQIEAMLNAILE